MAESEYLKELESQLLSADQNKVELNSSWVNGFPKEPGVYIAWMDNNIIYAGETGSLHGRMQDMRDTRHHTLRRHIGFELFSKRASSKEKFSPMQETELESYIQKKISISFIVVKLGRKELEEFIIDGHKPIYNQKGKRS